MMSKKMYVHKIKKNKGSMMMNNKKLHERLKKVKKKEANQA